MAPKADDSPQLILRVSTRGIIPAAAIDAETLAGLRIGTDLSGKVLKSPPSTALRAWWGLMSLVCKVDDRWGNSRALSNAILISLNCFETELLIGGQRNEPMSLKLFTDAQLDVLIERATYLIETEILPGYNVEELRRDLRKSRI